MTKEKSITKADQELINRFEAAKAAKKDSMEGRKYISSNTYPMDKIEEQNNAKTKTIAGKAISVRNLIKRIASGNPPSIAKQQSYAEHPRFDDFDQNLQKLDLVEAKQMFDDYAEQMERIETERNKKRQREYEQLVEKSKKLENTIAEMQEKEKLVNPTETE